MSKTVVGLFENQDHAEVAARRIKEQGLRTDDISIIAKHGETGDPYDQASSGGMQEDGSKVFSGTGDGNITPGFGMSGSMIPGSTGPAGAPMGVNDNISDGVISGGVLGGIAGLLIGAGSMIIPGLGIIAAAGPITGLLSGAVTGGVVGGLIDLGIPESKSRKYEGDVRRGKVLFSMKTDEEKVDRVTSILRNSGASNIEAY